jgi:hypothetical protein
MEVKITGRAMVVRSIPAETIQLVSKYEPQALQLKNEANEVIFGIECNKAGSGSISSHGISFNDVAADGSAQVTILIPNGITDIKAWVKDNFTTALARLETVAPEAISAATRAAGMEAQIMAAITVD